MFQFFWSLLNYAIFYETVSISYHAIVYSILESTVRIWLQGGYGMIDSVKPSWSVAITLQRSPQIKPEHIPNMDAQDAPGVP